MSAAEVIMWLEHYLYLSGQARSKKAAHAAAVHIVNELVDKGALHLTDATPSVTR